MSNEDTELNNLNEKNENPENGKCYKIEQGKKSRQFIAAILCEFM
jgi:hypothetical protein